jgi:site-specific DNA-methyltransferase (adenine-specific)
VLPKLQPDSFEVVVTDPPYGLGFMGKNWDAPRATARGFQEWNERWGCEALRVLKPGGYLLAFGGTRTYHRLTCGLEDAGFEIRDCVLWLYGTGFPKSLDVGKAIDKAARGVPHGGAAPTSANHGRFKTRATEGRRGAADRGQGFGAGPGQFMVQPDERELVDEAAQWNGWGTGLKPAHEPIVVARKPLAGTVVANVLTHGTGAINVDGCRIAFASTSDEVESKGKNQHAASGSDARANLIDGEDRRARSDHGGPGRWPANVVLSHTEDCRMVGTREVASDGHFPVERGPSGYGSAIADSAGGGLTGQSGLAERHLRGELVGVWECAPGCPVRLLDQHSGDRPGCTSPSDARPQSIYRPDQVAYQRQGPIYGDRGGASRFFYCAKASRAERNAGLGGSDEPLLTRRSTPRKAEDADWLLRNGNFHPTVKPIELMRYLVRLVTPPGGTVLDPFAGSGTTGAAAVMEGARFLGIEREAEYVAIARARIRHWAASTR